MTHFFSRSRPGQALGNGRQRGFSLVEIAIVLVIVGLALGAGLTMLGSQMQQKKINDTQRALEEARDALMGFAIVNGRLPRPATSAVNGAENPVNCVSEATCTGLIPWTTLGVTKLDGWAKVIRYSVTPGYTINPGLLLSTPGTKTIRTRVNAGPLVLLASAVPAVIFSPGKDNFGTTDLGVAIPNQAIGLTNVDEISNNTGAGIGPLGTNYVQRVPSASTVAPGVFDDMVIWLSSATLFNRMTQAGNPPPP